MLSSDDAQIRFASTARDMSLTLQQIKCTQSESLPGRPLCQVVLAGCSQSTPNPFISESFQGNPMIEVSTGTALGVITALITLFTLVIKLQRDRVHVQSQTVTREQSQDEAQNTVILRLIEVISTLNINLTRFADNYEKNTEAQLELSRTVKDLVTSNLEDRKFFRESLREMGQRIQEIHDVIVGHADG